MMCLTGSHGMWFAGELAIFKLINLHLQWSLIDSYFSGDKVKVIQTWK